MALIHFFISPKDKSFQCEDEMESSEGLVFLPNRLMSSAGYDKLWYILHMYTRHIIIMLRHVVL